MTTPATQANRRLGRSSSGGVRCSPITKKGSRPRARLRSKSSWLYAPASRLTTIEIGTITQCTLSTGVARRQMMRTARYHIGQRGLVQIGSSSGPSPTWCRNCTISHEKITYGTASVVISDHRCRGV